MAVDRELKCMALWKCVFCVCVCVTSPWPLNFHELIKSIKMTSIERASDTHSRTYPGRHIYNPSHSGHSRDREQMKEKEKRERENIDCQTTFQYCLINLISWQLYANALLWFVHSFSFFSSHLFENWICWTDRCFSETSRRCDEDEMRNNETRHRQKFISFNFDTWNDQLSVEPKHFFYLSRAADIFSFRFSVDIFRFGIHRLFHMRKISPKTMTTQNKKERHIRSDPTEEWDTCTCTAEVDASESETKDRH